MEVAKLVLEYIKVLVWPCFVLGVAFAYRVQVVAILARLKKADLPGGVSLDFAEEVNQVRELSEAVEPAKPKSVRPNAPAIPLTKANARMIDVGLRPSPSGLNMDYYRALAQQDPNVALAGLGIEVDIIARNLAKGFKVSVAEQGSGSRLLRHLQQEGAISVSQYELAQKVVRLCNAAIHGTPVTLEQANAVIGSADVLAKQYLAWLSWGFPDRWSAGPDSSKQANPNAS